MLICMYVSFPLFLFPCLLPVLLSSASSSSSSSPLSFSSVLRLLPLPRLQRNERNGLQSARSKKQNAARPAYTLAGDSLRCEFYADSSGWLWPEVVLPLRNLSSPLVFVSLTRALCKGAVISTSHVCMHVVGWMVSYYSTEDPQNN